MAATYLDREVRSGADVDACRDAPVPEREQVGQRDVECVPGAPTKLVQLRDVTEQNRLFNRTEPRRVDCDIDRDTGCAHEPVEEVTHHRRGATRDVEYVAT